MIAGELTKGKPFVSLTLISRQQQSPKQLKNLSVFTKSALLMEASSTYMNKLKQNIEFLSNIAIIVVAVAICAALVKHYFFTSPAPTSRQPAVGAKIELPGVDLSSAEKTLLVVLQKGCRYCTESGPFYQKLVREAAGRGQVKLVAVLPNNPDEGRRYLSDLGVTSMDVKQASLSSLSVGGTPTLIMLSRGTVSAVWVGKLDTEKEAEVLSKL